MVIKQCLQVVLDNFRNDYNLINTFSLSQEFVLIVTDTLDQFLISLYQLFYIRVLELDYK